MNTVDQMRIFNGMPCTYYNARCSENIVRFKGSENFLTSEFDRYYDNRTTTIKKPVQLKDSGNISELAVHEINLHTKFLYIIL